MHDLIFSYLVFTDHLGGMFIETNCYNESPKSLSWHLLFGISLSRLILFLHSIYNFIIMNIQWDKQSRYTWNCLWNMSFFSVYLWFLESKVFVCFKLISLDELAFTIKLQTENLNAIFEHIHQNIKAFPRSDEKSAIDYENIIGYSENSKQSNV